MSPRDRGRSFRYEGYDVDRDAHRVTCRYSLDGERYTETFTFPGGGDWDTPGADAAARLLFLLAGVSYYKTTAPPSIDLGDHPLTADERSLLHDYYVEGLGEFAYTNGLDLTDLEIVAPDAAPAGDARATAAATTGARADRPLVPFGGGLDSVVTVELVRPVADPALFIVSYPGDRFEAIERAAKVTGLPIVRAEREIDPRVRRPAPGTRWFHGHVPITGIISAIAVLAAVLEGRGAVVMSNEWSASMGTLEVDGRWINHQYSKSHDFEAAFRRVVQGSVATDVDYFSRLRPYSELWIAHRFAELTDYHLEFHSCNRAFASDPAKRLDHWCGVCPKCCFIDLILAPFLAEERLGTIFGGHEPLADPALHDEFARLTGTSATAKPFECVGDVDECRAAVGLALERPDRADFPLLRALADEVAAVAAAGAVSDPDRLLRPIGAHFVPERYATADLLV